MPKMALNMKSSSLSFLRSWDYKHTPLGPVYILSYNRESRQIQQRLRNIRAQRNGRKVTGFPLPVYSSRKWGWEGHFEQVPCI